MPGKFQDRNISSGKFRVKHPSSHQCCSALSGCLGSCSFGWFSRNYLTSPLQPPQNIPQFEKQEDFLIAGEQERFPDTWTEKQHWGWIRLLPPQILRGWQPLCSTSDSVSPGPGWELMWARPPVPGWAFRAGAFRGSDPSDAGWQTHHGSQIPAQDQQCNPAALPPMGDVLWAQK